MLKKILIASSLITASISYGYDCNSDCGKAAQFKYPCPTFGKPHRMCKGRDPVEYSACETVKMASCKMWEGAVDFAKDKMKPILRDRFNAGTWANAEGSGQQQEYMASCVAAGVSAAAILGTELGGPWGSAMGGAIGTFVSFRICEQSRTW
jgi:hypothetical protein